MTHILAVKDGELRRLLSLEEGWTEVDPPKGGYVDGVHRWINNEWVTDWSSVDKELIRQVDEDAGDVRSQYITITPGQEMVYMQKEHEALNYKAHGVKKNCPLLCAEAAAQDMDPADLADIVIRKAAEWKTTAGKIEAKRMAAKQSILSATTLEDKHKAAKVNWGNLKS